MQCTIILLLLSILLASWHTVNALSIPSERPQPQCRQVRCRRPLCANPVTPPGECCPSCENSGCKFEGCVNFRSDGRAQWQPDPCSFCFCSNNRTVCAVVACRFLTEDDCFGFPVTTKPDQCCPFCDFGIPEDKCAVVPLPFSQRNITVTDSRSSASCSKEVVEHECDKQGFRANGLKFRCVPREGKRLLRFKNTCPLCGGLYTDVVICRARRDDDITVGCDLVVP